MFVVTILKGSKVLKKKEFKTRPEANDFVFSEPHDRGSEYQIFDTEKDDIVDEGDTVQVDYGFDDASDDLFPDDESLEGFDVNDFWDKE